MSNYVTKSYLKGATSIDTSKFAIEFNIADLKSDMDKLDINKLNMFQAF